MKYQKFSNFSDLDRLSLLKGYLCSGQTKSVYSRCHGISATSLNHWLKRYGVSDLSSIEPLLSKYNMPSSEDELRSENLRLRQHIKHLEKESQNDKFRLKALNMLIDLTESTYKIPVRKNSNAK